MKINDVTALRLYLHSKAGVLMPHKESIAHDNADLVILGVPCVMDFGFSSSKKYSRHVVTSACVWIFGSSCPDFFGSFYLPVYEESQAPSILNSTIDHAIEQAKVNPKFAEVKAALKAEHS